MGLKLITAPTVEPVDLATAKAFLRVDHTDDDALIASLIIASRRHYDGPTGVLDRALITQEWDYTIDEFPSGTVTGGDWIRLPLAPVQTITSIGYIDSAGTEIALAEADYAAALGGDPAFVYPAAGSSWPTAGSFPGAAVVRFVAGYGDTADTVPPELTVAILQNIAYWYEYREETGKSFPGDATALPLRWAWPV